MDDLNIKVKSDSMDEFGKLADIINNLLIKINNTNMELKNEKGRLEYVLEATNDGYWDYNVKDNILYVSDRVKAIFGEDIKWDKLEYDKINIIHPDDKVLLMSNIRN